MLVIVEIDADGEIVITASRYRHQPPGRVVDVVAGALADALRAYLATPTPEPLHAEVVDDVDPDSEPAESSAPQDVVAGWPPRTPDHEVLPAIEPVPVWTLDERRTELFRLIDVEGKTLPQAAAAVEVSRAKARRWYIRGEPASTGDDTHDGAEHGHALATARAAGGGLALSDPARLRGPDSPRTAWSSVQPL